MMKTKFLTAFAVAALLGASASFAATAPSSKATASVSYLEPENFTDFKTSLSGGEDEQKALEDELNQQIARYAATYLPAGTQLKLRFRDIDLAGDFEPFHSGSWNDVRILRDIYFPRMDVEYSVTDAAGNVLASGERKLSDPSYQWTLRIHSIAMTNTEIEANLLRDFIEELGRKVS